MSDTALGINDVTEEVARVFADWYERKVTGKITVEINLRDGGIGSAEITEKKRMIKDTTTS